MVYNDRTFAKGQLDEETDRATLCERFNHYSRLWCSKPLKGKEEAVFSLTDITLTPVGGEFVGSGDVLRACLGLPPDQEFRMVGIRRIPYSYGDGTMKDFTGWSAKVSFTHVTAESTLGA